MPALVGLGLGLPFARSVGGGGPPPPVDALLTEDGDEIETEDGNLLEVE